MSEELDVDEIQAAVAIWKAYGDKPCRPPYLVPSNEEIQAAYVLADAFIILDEELKSDNTVELIEAMKEGFAVRLADVEAKLLAAKTALQLLRAKALACGKAMDAAFVVSVCDVELKGLQ